MGAGGEWEARDWKTLRSRSEEVRRGHEPRHTGDL